MLITSHHSPSVMSNFEWLLNVTKTNAYLSTLNDIYDYSTITSWISIFIWTSFILPLCLLLLLYLTAFSVHIYGLVNGLKMPASINDRAWDMWTNMLYLFWNRLGRLWHGYEIEGLENLPTEGGALLVYYHGACPVDMYFMLGDVLALRNRKMKLVVDRFMFKIPGWEALLNLLEVTPGSLDTCTKILMDGHIVAIAPGGVYEAQFSNSNYQLKWRKRIGYAKVAIQAKAPIIPAFTVNLREAYRTVSIGNSWLKKLYLKCRWPLAPIYGGYPVKLKTIIGEPIPYDPNVTAEELANTVKVAIKKLIADNQRIPGSIVGALLDRFYCQKKIKMS
ncbi:26S proteasome non-ATPase regulatory subunit 11 [Chamberlinius hualienensis]